MVRSKDRADQRFVNMYQSGQALLRGLNLNYKVFEDDAKESEAEDDDLWMNQR